MRINNVQEKFITIIFSVKREIRCDVMTRERKIIALHFTAITYTTPALKILWKWIIQIG